MVHAFHTQNIRLCNHGFLTGNYLFCNSGIYGELTEQFLRIDQKLEENKLKRKLRIDF